MSKSFLILSEQMALQPHLPTVLNNVDYHLLQAQLKRIDEILSNSQLEEPMLQSALQRWLDKGSQTLPTVGQQLKFQRQCRQALRCNIARVLLGESFRDFSIHLAESHLLQWFCRIDCLEVVRVPSKSSLQRFTNWFSIQEISQLNVQCLGQAAQDSNPLDLEETIDMETLFMDSTCVKANIHFPVDWVLLRDATRTLIGTIQCIRSHGLKHRMPDPEKLMGNMNQLCIEMTHCPAQADNNKGRKRILRLMKSAVDQVARHARTYQARLSKEWFLTDWTQPQAQAAIDRMEKILSQLPAAKKQAHERIIGERQVANAEKVLSLYEPDTHVIVRGKSGAKVEFGNGLLLVENTQGLLVHWEFYRDKAPADSQLVKPTIEAIQALHGIQVQAVGTDRGFETKANVRYLEEQEIFNALCARQPGKKRDPKEQEPYEGMQKRRAQTEARIGIFKNQFLGRPMRGKGFTNREVAVSWAALTHNLWVLARLPMAPSQEEGESKLQAA